MEEISYTPPETLRHYIVDHTPGALFYDFVVGPYGSGKTTALFMKLIYMAKLQQRGPDGVRRSRCVIVRNTAPQLSDTTIKSWEGWFKDGQAGHWHLSQKIFDLKFDDVECEVMFRPLDTADDIARVLSLEVTFANIDEFIEIPIAIIAAPSARLGRYPSKPDGGATNWGMWGASNTSTEDNWWYDYLHDPEFVERVDLYEGHFAQRDSTLRKLTRRPENGINVRYFKQPSGLGPDAENVENLPGKREYYVNQAKGKTAAWIGQYLDAEWGFSASETPVLKSFNPKIHISANLKIQPMITIAFGIDPGLAGTAFIFGQEDLYGRLTVIGECGAVGIGMERFIDTVALPYIRTRFRDAELVAAPDPAAGNRAQTDETKVISILKKSFTVKPQWNNRLGVRIDAMDHYTTLLLPDVGPALLVDKVHAPMLCKALAGGWKYEKAKRSSDDTYKPAPEKNIYSHYGDAFSYLCRHYVQQYEKSGVRGQMIGSQATRRAMPVSRPVNYHAR